MDTDLAAAFRSRPEFRAREDGDLDVEGTDFEARIVLGEKAVLLQELPTLDATVVGETVADVVEDGWEETFRRRVGDVGRVIGAASADPEITREGDLLRVEIPLPTDPAAAPEAAIAAANYVEGTWVEGIIPGYEYGKRVQAIRNRARETGDT